MKPYSKDGIEMMEVKSIGQDGDRIVLKGKMMGAMATTIYVAPEDLWSAFRLFPAKTILRLPFLLIKGSFRRRCSAAKQMPNRVGTSLFELGSLVPNIDLVRR